MVEILIGAAAFGRRIDEAYQKLKLSVGSNQDRQQRALENAFSTSTFIYGTVGPVALHAAAGNRGNAAARGAAQWVKHTKDNLLAKGVNPEAGVRFLNREFKLYDPGPRTAQLVAGNYQMMDMYYGMDNTLFRNRIPAIAEFVHYAMQFDKMGVPFDPNVSGRDAFKQAFNTSNEGWNMDFTQRRVYGQSATQEMSKIIREGISRYGGRLIFEGKAVYGAGIFDLAARQGDTDREAQALFQNFNVRGTPMAPLGQGILEFQWGGQATTPTRAHFLTNWSYAGPSIHGVANRIHMTDKTQTQTGHLNRLMGPNHGLRPIWNNFVNFPLSVYREINRLRGLTVHTSNQTAADNMRDAINLLTLAIHS
ncbi:hypothetical protein [Ascidiaceihabitans sp.]|uniref:hypothetical protein n=1 Tax=Ascidiaceihabitans sp. TaxID=1872644 RepID=UPI00329839AA